MHDESVIDTVVDVLAELAGDGRALDFGLGTGGIALPLARRGVDVYGIDLSKAMVARLHEKPGGARSADRYRETEFHQEKCEEGPAVIPSRGSNCTRRDRSRPASKRADVFAGGGRAVTAERGSPCAVIEFDLAELHRRR